MILYQNSNITFNYTPETDILLVEWPGVEPYMLLEIKYCLQKLFEILRDYDVKNLLIDASKANINLTNEDYRAIIKDLEAALGKTHLQKLARIMTSDPLREEKIYTIRQQVNFPYDFRDFKTKEEAMKWLSG